MDIFTWYDLGIVMHYLNIMPCIKNEYSKIKEINKCHINVFPLRFEFNCD